MGVLQRTGALAPPKGERLLPVITGLLLVLAFPPFQLPGLPFIALVPLLLLLSELPPGREGRWRAARAGFLAGVVYFGLLVYWLVVALIYYSLLAIPAYVLTTLILAGFIAGFAAALHYIWNRLPSVPAALAVAVLWTAFEWLQGHLGDVSFPWLGLGTALAGRPWLAGAADLVGARGLGFWLALVNGLVAMLILRLRAGRRVRWRVAATAAVVVLPVAYGAWRAETIRLEPAAQVAVVQPNIPEDLKMNRALAVDSSMTALVKLTARIPEGSVDLVAWPEVAVPVVLRYESSIRERIRRASERVGAPIVLGGYGIQREPGAGVTLYNSAFLMTPDGLRGGRYDKQRLVPFVERIPFIDPAWLEPVTGDLQYFGAMGAGKNVHPFRAGGTQFGVLICYESIFPGVSRAYRLAGVDFLVNITNDAWYGREPWYSRTTALWQHPAHLSMRAIENRIGIARSANTGISMFVGPLGNSYEATPLFEPTVRVATVYSTDGLTLYARWGDWLATAAALVAVALLLAAWRAGGPSWHRIEAARGRWPVAAGEGAEGAASET